MSVTDNTRCVSCHSARVPVSGGTCLDCQAKLTSRLEDVRSSRDRARSTAGGYHKGLGDRAEKRSGSPREGRALFHRAKKGVGES